MIQKTAEYEFNISYFLLFLNQQLPMRLNKKSHECTEDVYLPAAFVAFDIGLPQSAARYLDFPVIRFGSVEPKNCMLKSRAHFLRHLRAKRLLPLIKEK